MRVTNLSWLSIFYSTVEILLHLAHREISDDLPMIAAFSRMAFGDRRQAWRTGPWVAVAATTAAMAGGREGGRERRTRAHTHSRQREREGERGEHTHTAGKEGGRERRTRSHTHSHSGALSIARHRTQGWPGYSHAREKQSRRLQTAGALRFLNACRLLCAARQALFLLMESS